MKRTISLGPSLQLRFISVVIATDVRLRRLGQFHTLSGGIPFEAWRFKHPTDILVRNSQRNLTIQRFQI